jgi:hypothetical protein
MKTLLIIVLIAFSLCENFIPGGWKKRSVFENDLEIEQSFKNAFADYKKANKVNDDDLIRLTVYSKVVSGMLYKVTFVDSLAEVPIVQEYEIYKSLKNTNDQNFQVERHKEYEAKEGLIPFNDPKFTLLENQLHTFLKDSKEELNFISYVYPVENDETNFFMINAYTDDGEHQYIVCQDRDSEEFYHFEKIK